METVKDYVSSLPDERQRAVSAVREVIRENLPKGYVEAFNWGMISYEVPLKVVGDTYNGKPLMYAALASKKNHMAVYLPAVYADPDLRSWFVDSYSETGKKLDMGKSCIRFKKLDDLPVDLVGEAIARKSIDEYIRLHDEVRQR